MRAQETVADFTLRIRRLVRERETGKKYSVIGASRAADCVTRKAEQQPKPRKK